MYSLTIENKYGQTMELTHNSRYVITNIDGLNPPDAIINTTRNANADGSVFNSSYVNNRTIIITIAINEPAQQNRIALYKYFKAKYPVRLYYKNSDRDVYIDGYVKNVPIDFFAQKQIFQVTIFCPDPFFKVNTNSLIDFSTIQKLFQFPFSIETPISFGEILIENERNIYNAGDVDTGAIFVIRAKGSVTNPTIYNVDRNERFSLNITLSAGDEVQINTKQKQKSVVLISQGTTTNIVGNVASGSTWLQLSAGDNIFTTGAAARPENMETYCILTDLFEGV